MYIHWLKSTLTCNKQFKPQIRVEKFLLSSSSSTETRDCYRLWSGLDPLGANLFSSSKRMPNLLRNCIVLLSVPSCLLVLESFTDLTGTRRGLTLTSTRTSSESETANANLGHFITSLSLLSPALLIFSSLLWNWGSLWGDLLRRSDVRWGDDVNSFS